MQADFIITSALNTRFGVFSADQRLEQTFETIRSIRSKLPDSRIFLVEMGGIQPSAEQVAALASCVDRLLVYSGNRDVRSLYEGTNNWDVVKNVTEISCLNAALTDLTKLGVFKKPSRVFKISGRYRLSEDFATERFVDWLDGIYVRRRYASHFSEQLTGGIRFQYMSRLWSWPSSFNEVIEQTLRTGLQYILALLSQGGYCDVEHVLFNFLPKALVIELDKIGVEGRIGPNGVYVRD